MTNVVSGTRRFWLRVAIVSLGAAFFAGEASAQIGWAPAGEVCTSERTVSGFVTEKKTCVRWKPVTQVCMKREDCVTYRDECRVGYRPEQYVECVPKTCYDQVTVDEGCWKMVWCPKPVTKVVPRQTIEKRIACRNVPYTYTEKVPQVVSRWVPEYKTAYVPEKYTTCERRPFCQTLPSQTTAMMPPAVTPGCAAPIQPGCAVPMQPDCAVPGYSPSLAPGVPTYAPNGANSDSPAVPSGVVPEPTADPMSYYPTQQPQNAAAANPGDSATWSTVKPRQAPGQGSGSLSAGSRSLASTWTGIWPTRN